MCSSDVKGLISKSYRGEENFYQILDSVSNNRSSNGKSIFGNYLCSNPKR